MSLLNFNEILPPRRKLSNFLSTEIKNQCNWRENKPDAINDQIKYFDVYFTKHMKDSHINKDLMVECLKESEKVHQQQLNSNIVDKSMFLELDTNDEEIFNNSCIRNLYYYDNECKNLNFVSFKLDKKEEVIEKEGEVVVPGEYNIVFEDWEEWKANFDTNVRQMRLPEANLFKTENITSSCVFMDMYSIYNLSVDIDDQIRINSFDKVLTMEEIPNSYMSQTMIDRLFVISNSPHKNRISLIDQNFKLSAVKNLDDYNILEGKHFVKGEFVNHPSIVLLFKNSGEIIISDFRSERNFDQRIINDNKDTISDIKFVDEFNFLVFSTKSISLYDLRYPSIRKSQHPLNINYKDMEIKKVKNIEDLDYYYIGVDPSRKDNSHLLFHSLNQDQGTTNLEFFSDFIDIKLIQSRNIPYVHDSTGLLVNDNLYINFTLDSFGGLYSQTFQLDNCTDFTKSNVFKISGNFKSTEGLDKTISLDDQIVSLYEKEHINSFFNTKKDSNEVDNVNYESKIADEDNEEDLSDFEEESSESSEENEIDFGTAKVNGEKTKLYKIQNKRKVVDKIIKDINKHIEDQDIEMSPEYEHKLSVNEKNEDLEWLFTSLEEQIYTKKDTNKNINS